MKSKDHKKAAPVAIKKHHEGKVLLGIPLANMLDRPFDIIKAKGFSVIKEIAVLSVDDVKHTATVVLFYGSGKITNRRQVRFEIDTKTNVPLSRAPSIKENSVLNSVFHFFESDEHITSFFDREKLIEACTPYFKSRSVCESLNNSSLKTVLDDINTF